MQLFLRMVLQRTLMWRHDGKPQVKNLVRLSIKGHHDHHDHLDHPDHHDHHDHPDHPDCSVSQWRPQKVDKRMVLEHTHCLFIN